MFGRYIPSVTFEEEVDSGILPTVEWTVTHSSLIVRSPQDTRFPDILTVTELSSHYVMVAFSGWHFPVNTSYLSTSPLTEVIKDLASASDHKLLSNFNLTASIKAKPFLRHAEPLLQNLRSYLEAK